MTENVENLLLDHMKRFQASLDRIERRLDELTTRQTETHTAVLAVRRDQVNDAEVSARLQVQLDAVRARLDRIESRLELSS